MGELEVSDTGISGRYNPCPVYATQHNAHTHLLQDDYHIIAPDLRGFGASTHPGDVKSSGNMPDLVGDIMCIMKHAGVPHAIAIGYVAPRNYNSRRFIHSLGSQGTTGALS